MDNKPILITFIIFYKKQVRFNQYLTVQIVLVKNRQSKKNFI